MTERELVQKALAGLPRPAPPPRLHRAVMTSVAAEAKAASPVRSWSRTEEGGWTTERWEGAGGSGAILPAPASAHITYTRWRQDEPGRTTIYQFTQTR